MKWTNPSAREAAKPRWPGNARCGQRSRSRTPRLSWLTKSSSPRPSTASSPTRSLLGSLLPPIENPVGINAGLCPTQAGQSGPCAGIEASALSYGLSVENTNTVAIAGLAITGATTGIRVVNSSKSFVARNNWLGEKLDGTNGSGSNTGIWLDPESDNATIGSTTAGQGNVFVNNAAEGLDIEGASNADVLGNYFGVKADGATVAANGKNIEITDANGFEATDNEVGTKVEGAPSRARLRRRLQRDLPAAASRPASTWSGRRSPARNRPPGRPRFGATTSGLVPMARPSVANGTFDILVGGAEDATVGGESPGEANYIAGGGYGIYLRKRRRAQSRRQCHGIRQDWCRRHLARGRRVPARHEQRPPGAGAHERDPHGRRRRDRSAFRRLRDQRATSSKGRNSESRPRSPRGRRGPT